MLTQIIPSYLYDQYRNEDTPEAVIGPDSAIAGIAVAGFAIAGNDAGLFSVSDLQAFVNAYNAIAQGYLDSVNSLNLPIYTLQSGAMLDWVAYGLYGSKRPSLAYGSTYTPLGVYNTEPYNVTAYSEDIKSGAITIYTVTDDYFKRILTWNFYKGDGFQFNIPWLKRRVKRFLYGLDGVSPDIQETYEISVTVTAPNFITITIPNVAASPVLAACIAEGVLNLPFQFIFTVSY